MKWLIRFLMKSVISATQRAVVLCRKIAHALKKAADALKTIQNEEAVKLAAELETVKTAVAAVEAVLIKVLEKLGSDVPSEDGTVGTLVSETSNVNKLLKD